MTLNNSTHGKQSQNIQRHTKSWKKRPWHRYFPVNFAKFLRKPPVAASNSIKNDPKTLIDSKAINWVALWLISLHEYF